MASCPVHAEDVEDVKQAYEEEDRGERLELEDNEPEYEPEEEVAINYIQPNKFSEFRIHQLVLVWMSAVFLQILLEICSGHRPIYHMVENGRTVVSNLHCLLGQRRRPREGHRLGGRRQQGRQCRLRRPGLRRWRR